MLGPNIRAIPVQFPKTFNCKFISTMEGAVASIVHRVDVSPGRESALKKLSSQINEPTLIFCSSPASAKRVADILMGIEPRSDSKYLNDAANWIDANFHPDWQFGRALRHGIGIHHGRIPRALAQYVVRSFNNGRLKYLVCTSTLIEGVNTAAKNVVIYDNRIATSKFDYFTFNNIRGRSGRMFRHFVGHVYLFYEPPPESLWELEIPFFSQTEETPETLLIQMDKDDLTDRSVTRIEKFERQDILSIQTLRGNKFIDPDDQIALAQEILDDLRRYHSLLEWQGFPGNFDQLRAICNLIFSHFSAGTQMGARTGSQLAFRISYLAQTKSIKSLIDQEIQNPKSPGSNDEKVETILNFVRHWATFHFPRLLMAIDLIQKDVFTRNQLIPGDYKAYAESVENLFLSPALVALDEYGIPLQLAIKLSSKLDLETSLDEALSIIKRINVNEYELHPFEREILEDVTQFI